MKEKKCLWVLIFAIIMGLILYPAQCVAADNIDTSAYTSTYAYDALAERNNGSNRQKLYNDIAGNILDFWNSDENLTTRLEDGEYVYAYLDYNAYNLTVNDVIETYYSFRNDNPIFYFVSSSCRFSNGILTLSTDADYKEGSERTRYKEEIVNCVKVIVDEANQYDKISDKVIAVHNNIVERTQYSYGEDGKPSQAAYAHSIIGSLCRGEGVCESYAKTFQIVMNCLGIDNMLVTGTSYGESHMWNVVKCDDGQYYYVDCTWDDTTFSNNYLLKGTNTFDADHIKNTPDAVGVDYLYELPAASVDDYFKCFTLKKGDTEVGRFASVGAAFTKMDDSEAKYSLDIDPDTRVLVPAGNWPKVKEISFNNKDKAFVSVEVLGDATVQSDIVLNDVYLNTHNSFLENNKRNSVMNIGDNSFTVNGMSRIGGNAVYVSGPRGSGVNVRGSKGSALYINSLFELITEYIDVDKIIINNTELHNICADIIANEMYYNNSSAVRLLNTDNEIVFDVKKSIISKDDSGYMYVSDIKKGSDISVGIITGSNALFCVTVTCSTGEYQSISITDSNIPINVDVSNYQVYCWDDPDTNPANYEIWDGLYDYKGPIINVGKTPMTKISYVTYSMATMSDNNQPQVVAGENFVALCEKDKDGNVYRKYDENYYIIDGVLYGYHYYDKVSTTVFDIPAGVKRIEPYAFVYGDYIKEITLPASVTKIGEGAFSGCKSLKEIMVSPAVTDIGNYAFGYYMVDGTMYKISGFKIICVKNSAAYNYAVENGISYKLIPENVKNFKQENATYNSVTLKWSKVDKATGYVIKQYKNGKWVTVKNTKSNTAVITCLSETSSYKFKITAYIKDGTVSRYSLKETSLTAVTGPKAVTNLKAARKGKSSLRLTWKRNAKAAGYVVEMKKNSKWVKVYTTKKNTSVSYTANSLKKGTYYFRVKSYKKIGSKTYYSGYKTVSVRR